MKIDFEILWKHVLDHSPSTGFLLHGPEHWRQVERNALLLAPETGADPIVIRLFALFHDSCRLNEGVDDGHGPRGAKYAASLRDSLYHLDDDRFTLLTYACQWHTDADHHADPTIGTCWDADRLDLGRVGVIPDPKFMSTARGRALAEVDNQR